MKLTDKGVDVMMNIDNGYKDIPRKTKAVVANRSAVGEQFVDLQPQTKQKPYLENGSDIPMAMTDTPIETTKLLGDLSTTTESVNKKSLRITVNELGTAFNGTGPEPRARSSTRRTTSSMPRTRTSTSPRRCSRTATRC